MIEEKSLDIFAEKLAKLRELFPEVLSEGKIDFKRLQSVLGDEVLFHKEHYELSWAGKSDARAQIQKATSATLIPDSGINAEESQNVFIEGENLEVLHVLQRAYFGKIKMIYIDPPYNTGNDSFVYPDDYSERQDEYKKRAGITDENGFLNKQDCWKKNSKENGQFHSVWLSMMYPRLYLARNLLREDGVIFISIDDNEQANLKLLCDEIFGAENFISEIVIQSNKRGQTYKEIAKTHEYLFMYSKSENFCLFELEKDGDSLPYEDSKGKFDLWELRNRNPKFGRFNRPNLYFPIYVSKTLLDENGYSKISLEQNEIFTEIALPKNSSDEDSCWRWSKEKIIKEDTTSQTPVLIAKQKKNGDWNIYERARKLTTKAKSIWDDTSVISEQGTTALGLLGLKNIFDHPKPLGLLNKLLQISSENNDIILDFFAGSGTTAHAVLDLNEQDGGNRQFICVQMPEVLDETSEAYKAGYRTIADICKTRISKVVEKIQTERDSQKQSDLIPAESKQVLGFKSFKLAPSNFKQWRSDVDEAGILEQLKLFKDSEQPHSENDAMLVELLLKAGLPLTTKVETHTVAEQVIYSVESGKLLFFFDDYNANVKDFIFTLKPKRVVCLNRVFKNDDQALTNFQLGLKDAGCELQII